MIAIKDLRKFKDGQTRLELDRLEVEAVRSQLWQVRPAVGNRSCLSCSQGRCVPGRVRSNGMKQRLLIARALLHQPEVLFLDEPTRGLDPHIAQELRGLVRQRAGSGVTIILTTHYLEEADQLCDRVAFIDEGRIIAMDTPERLKLIYGERTVQAHLSDGSQTTFAIGKPDEGQRLGELVGIGHLVSLHSGEATLEDVFIQLTGRRIET